MTAQLLFTQTQSQSDHPDHGAEYGQAPPPDSTGVGQTQTQSPRNLPPLVILHGLFGSWENWGSRVREYARYTTVYAMDLRNHGDSPHCQTMSYPEMAADVFHTLDNLGISRFDLLGHSMGGKVAMQMASEMAGESAGEKSSRIERLVIVDIAPKEYPAHHTEILNALQAIDVASLESRRDADQQLASVESNQVVRAFILKNLVRVEDESNNRSKFKWQFNIQALHDNYPELLLAPTVAAPYSGPTLFIKGSESDYLGKNDTDAIMNQFPQATLKILSGTGHWPHAEKPQLFDRILGDFLDYPN